MTIDELEKRIRLLQAEIAAVRINSAGGGADPAELQKIWDELNALNTDFLALQNQVDGVDTKASNAAALAESAYDNANSAHALAEVAQKDAQTALTQTATLDANKVGKTANANQLYGNDANGVITARLKYQAMELQPGGDIVFRAITSRGTLQTGTPTDNYDCANKKYVDDNVKKLYKHNIVVSNSEGSTFGVVIIYSSYDSAYIPSNFPSGRYIMAPYINGDRWYCFIERIGFTYDFGRVSLIQSGSDIGVIYETTRSEMLNFTDTVTEI